MTKDQMRILLSTLVPAAEARGDIYHFTRVGSGNAPGKMETISGVSMATNEQPQVRPARPRRIHQRQGIYGAGFEIETYKLFQGVGKDDVSPAYTITAPAYFCSVCEKDGKDCTC